MVTRIFLLVLLALLLPLRGVSAAALACGPQGPASHTVMAAAVQEHCGQQDGHDEADAGRLGAACCPAVALVATGTVALAPPSVGSTAFPSWSAPVPRFESSAPERPPRSR